MDSSNIKLLIGCPDARGVIAAVSGFVADHDGNIVESDQHTDLEHGEFFMRVEIEHVGFRLDSQSFPKAWESIARRFRMQWRVDWGDRIKRLAILVGKQTHCLQDLLWRWRAGELSAEIPLVISNHDDARVLTESYGVTFEEFPVSKASMERDQGRIIDRLDGAGIDLVVLARFMQILRHEFVARFPNRIINIHHSFLPAFAGSRPYHQAFDRGVKVIGATSHYVTDQLDEGPIIEQSVVRVSHRDTVRDMIRKGRDLERMVLAEAVRLHLDDKVLATNGKTVVFD